MEIEEILKQCAVSGNVVSLPNIQLDRKTYLEVAQKLELIGGKWNRKLKGFLFNEDPTELLTDIQNGVKRNLKKEFQFFETPNDLAEELCSFIPERTIRNILEPSAGRGAIVRAVKKVCPDVPVYYCELMELNRKMFKGDAEFLCEDFLKLDENQKFEIVIANPPFNKNQDIEHFYKMVKVCSGRVISIMSTHWQHCNNKKEVAFRKFLEENNAKVINISSGRFKQSGTMIASCIVVMDIK